MINQAVVSSIDTVSIDINKVVFYTLMYGGSWRILMENHESRLEDYIKKYRFGTSPLVTPKIKSYLTDIFGQGESKYSRIFKRILGND